MNDLRVQQLEHARGLPLPHYASEGAAGLDLYAAVTETLELAPLQRAAVPTGLVMAVPRGFEGQVRARSGTALREGLALVNAPGTIDADYRGEVKVLVINLGQASIRIERGQRLAQLVICPVERVQVLCVESLDETNRGAGGFGSTGR